MSFTKEDAIQLAKTQEEVVYLRFELYLLERKSVISNLKRFYNWFKK